MCSSDWVEFLFLCRRVVAYTEKSGLSLLDVSFKIAFYSAAVIDLLYLTGCCGLNIKEIVFPIKSN